MNTDLFLNTDLLNNNLNSTVIPILGEENTSLEIQQALSKFTDPFNKDLSLIEQAIQAQDDSPEINSDRSTKIVSTPNLDSIIGSKSQNFQVNNVDFNDTSFAPPKSELDFKGGFGDYNGGNDITLKIKDLKGTVIETFALSGKGQGEVYRDDNYEYIFFIDTDDTTKVDISAKSNLKFGNYFGDSLEIETTGGIDGGEVVLNEPNTDSGLVLKSGLATIPTIDYQFGGYDLIDFGDVELVDINNYGEVVGNLIDFDSREKGFFYDGIDLFTLNFFDRSRINGVNDLGDIVGEYRNPSETIPRPFFTQNGRF